MTQSQVLFAIRATLAAACGMAPDVAGLYGLHSARHLLPEAVVGFPALEGVEVGRWSGSTAQDTSLAPAAQLLLAHTAHVVVLPAHCAHEAKVAEAAYQQRLQRQLRLQKLQKQQRLQRQLRLQKLQRQLRLQRQQMLQRLQKQQRLQRQLRLQKPQKQQRLQRQLRLQKLQRQLRLQRRQMLQRLQK